VPLRLPGHRRHQRVAVGEVPERRARRYRGPARGLAHGDLGAFGRQLQRSIDQHAAKVAVVVRPGLGCLAARARPGGLMGGHPAF
jgi:hypothetical protein